MPRRKKCNREKSWFVILREIAKRKGKKAAWCYVTALRGPDADIPSTDTPLWYVKAVFTAPLRAQAEGLVVADESSYHLFTKHPADVLKALRLLVSKKIPRHYLAHLISAWYVLEPKVARVLEQVQEMKRIQGVELSSKIAELEGLSIEYMREVAGWLGRTNAVSEEESKDE